LLRGLSQVWNLGSQEKYQWVNFERFLPLAVLLVGLRKYRSVFGRLRGLGKIIESSGRLVAE